MWNVAAAAADVELSSSSVGSRFSSSRPHRLCSSSSRFVLCLHQRVFYWQFGIAVMHCLDQRGRWKCWTWKWRTWNWRTSVQGMKLQDVKMMDQMTGHENAGHEIAGHKRVQYETGSDAPNVRGRIDWIDLAFHLCSRSLLRYENVAHFISGMGLKLDSIATIAVFHRCSRQGF